METVSRDQVLQEFSCEGKELSGLELEGRWGHGRGLRLQGESMACLGFDGNEPMKKETSLKEEGGKFLEQCPLEQEREDGIWHQGLTLAGHRDGLSTVIGEKIMRANRLVGGALTDILGLL